MGVVYYANYLVWFEVARTDLLRDIRLDAIARWRRRGFSLPVIEAQCDYRAVGEYDDEIEVQDDGRHGLGRAHGVHLSGGPPRPTRRRCATGVTVHAALDRDGKPCRLPDARAQQLFT